MLSKKVRRRQEAPSPRESGPAMRPECACAKRPPFRQADPRTAVERMRMRRQGPLLPRAGAVLFISSHLSSQVIDTRCGPRDAALEHGGPERKSGAQTRLKHSGLLRQNPGHLLLASNWGSLECGD